MASHDGLQLEIWMDAETVTNISVYLFIAWKNIIHTSEKFFTFSMQFLVHSIADCNHFVMSTLHTMMVTGRGSDIEM